MVALTQYEKDVIKYLKSINKELEKMNKGNKVVKLDAEKLAEQSYAESLKRGY